MKITTRDLKLFIERYETGDPLKDWYDEIEIYDMLHQLAKFAIQEIENKQRKLFS